MADYAELLARLDGPGTMRTEDERGWPLDEEQFALEVSRVWHEERDASAAAIRALIAERDAAVAAEREACAKVCSSRAITVRQRGSLDVWKTAASCEAMECAAAIRARANG